LKDAQLSVVLDYTSNYRKEFEDSETEQALGVTFEIKTANNPVKINVGVKNIFNTKYI
jgi:hypothetical protein